MDCEWKFNQEREIKIKLKASAEYYMAVWLGSELAEVKFVSFDCVLVKEKKQN